MSSQNYYSKSVAWCHIYRSTAKSKPLLHVVFFPFYLKKKSSFFFFTCVQVRHHRHQMLTVWEGLEGVLHQTLHSPHPFHYKTENQIYKCREINYHYGVPGNIKTENMYKLNQIQVTLNGQKLQSLEFFYQTLEL